MADNIVQTLQHLLQDVIAPDVRELKIRVTSLEKQMDVRFEAMDQMMHARFESIDLRFISIDQRFTAMDQKMDAQFKALMAAISESKAQSELTSLRVISSLSERVAVLESRSH
jgi:hypothetical protein